MMIFPLAPSSLMLVYKLTLSILNISYIKKLKGAFWYYTCVRPKFCPGKEANDMEKLRIEIQERERSPRQ